MKKQLVLSIFFTLSWVVVAQANETAESFNDKPRVTVQGEGKITAIPDRARVWVEVSEEGTKLADVTEMVRHKIATVLKSIKDQGIADKDIQTQSYQVAPEIDWSPGKPKRIGFTVSNRIEIVIHDLKKAGTVVASVLDAGANGVNGPQYEFENPQSLERQALQSAVQDAKAKAELIAKESGASVGKALDITEGGVAFPTPPRPIRLHAMAMAARITPSEPEPIEEGQETVTASVTATYELR